MFEKKQNYCAHLSPKTLLRFLQVTTPHKNMRSATKHVNSSCIVSIIVYNISLVSLFALNHFYREGVYTTLREKHKQMQRERERERERNREREGGETLQLF